MNFGQCREFERIKGGAIGGGKIRSEHLLFDDDDGDACVVGCLKMKKGEEIRKWSRNRCMQWCTRVYKETRNSEGQ